MGTVVASAVPVALAVAPERCEQLTRLVEGALGWPIVAPGDVELPPVAVIADVVGAPAGEDRWRVPTVLLVAADDAAPAVASAAVRADGVLAWPTTPDRLRAAVLGTAPDGDRRPVCSVVGAAGGVGATTVALAIAGLHAWEHGRTLAVVSGPTHLPDAPVVAAGDLASPAMWSAGSAVPGLSALRAVGLRGPVLGTPAVGDVPTVLDAGVVPDDAALRPDVVVVRPDGTGLGVARTTAASWVVVVGTGPVGHRAIADAGGQRLVRLRADPRVAAACLAGRHPTDAPGSWLRPLVPVVDALVGPT